MRLGLVTYNLAKDWDIPTIIKMCEATGFEAVELRTTHKHGVEPTMNEEQRQRVKEQFATSRVRLLSLGTVCEYHSLDPKELKRNIEVTKEFVRLAHDVGALGVKVRPNALPEGVPVKKTLEQIGKALKECGDFATGFGIGIWLEVHGRGTSELKNIRTIMEVADHPQVGVCWNSNQTDRDESGSIKKNFALVKDWIRNVHINELWTDYPWRELFTLLRESGYEGYTLAEIPESPEPERIMRYYRALWRELQSA